MTSEDEIVEFILAHLLFPWKKKKYADVTWYGNYTVNLYIGINDLYIGEKKKALRYFFCENMELGIVEKCIPSLSFQVTYLSLIVFTIMLK